MKLYVALFTIACPPALLQAQTQPVDCSHRTAEDYVTMSRTERLAEYLRDLTGPQAYFYSGALAGIDQAIDRPREWGQGGLGYARRYGSDFAEHVIATTLQNGFAVGLDEDNRYFNSGAHGFGRRLRYALTSPFLARHSNGSRSLSLSALGGVAGASAIEQIWQPRSTATFGNAAIIFGGTFALRAGVDVLREFAPRKLGALLQ
jgi:hypothetical protein